MTGAPTPTRPDAILETALYVRDIDRARAFYGGILGLAERVCVADRHVFFACGPGMLLLFRADATQHATGPLPVPTHGAVGEGHVCFRVLPEMFAAWIARFDAHDVAIEADVRWPHGARSIYVRDPDCNSVEFSEPALWNLGPA